ncbi:hypothetical protein MPH_08373 [Macrophomina phaseolina MS6]|uniref:Short-chain dehydrogenase/reductase SDR n=1 Tax=Macrophomina phaseolina (strain MS6) TaxID=1126212 RepID=K2RWG1_MACPH|nr:hypothetical protein MPH_08373 [Macrophomina phaseolina MS6]
MTPSSVPVNVRSHEISKAALNMLTANYALHLENEGFTVVAVNPGVSKFPCDSWVRSKSDCCTSISGFERTWALPRPLCLPRKAPKPRWTLYSVSLPRKRANSSISVCRDGRTRVGTSVMMAGVFHGRREHAVHPATLDHGLSTETQIQTKI